MHKIKNPPLADLEKYVLNTVRHSVNVEYYAQQLGVNSPDPERPHDLVGEGNKFEQEVMFGLAWEFHYPRLEQDSYLCHIKSSLCLHRQQYHHRHWNGNDLPEGEDHSTLELCAVDALCSLRENRGYQGGEHNDEEIFRMVQDNPFHKKLLLTLTLQKMQTVESPNLKAIQSSLDFPNFGLEERTYQRIKERAREAMEVVNGIEDLHQRAF